MSDTGQTDRKDRTQARVVAISLILLLIILVVAVILLLPALAEIIDPVFSPGLGLKPAAVIAFFITLIVMIVLTIAAGDGLLGELQFILSGFGLFFLILWLMIAWIF